MDAAVATPSVPAITTKQIAVIEQELKAIQSKIAVVPFEVTRVRQDHDRSLIPHALRAGALLAEAKKASLPHGQWLPWLRDLQLRLGCLSERQAQNYLLLHEHRDEIRTGAGFRSIKEALRWIRARDGAPREEKQADRRDHLLSVLAQKYGTTKRADTIHAALEDLYARILAERCVPTVRDAA